MHDEALQELRVEPVHVLERVEHENRGIGAKEDGRIADRPGADRSAACAAGESFASAVATLTAVVVVPTPPLAPTKAKTGPPTALDRCPSKRVIAASTSACRSGSASTR